MRQPPRVPIGRSGDRFNGMRQVGRAPSEVRDDRTAFRQIKWKLTEQGQALGAPECSAPMPEKPIV